MANRKRAHHNAELQEMSKYGVPNWKRIKMYPNWGSLSIDQKRWEFLRRTQAYRDDWVKAIKNNESITNNHSKFNKPFNLEKLAGKYRLSEPIDPKTNSFSLPKDFSISIEKKILLGGDIIFPRPSSLKKLEQEIAEEAIKLRESKESLSKEAFSEKHIALIKKSVPLIVEKETLRMLKPPKDYFFSKVWVEFDLSKNLRDQIDSVEAKLKIALKEARAFHESLKTTDYYTPDAIYKPEISKNKKIKCSKSIDIDIVLLRIMDGRNSGRTNLEISNILDDDGIARDASTISKDFKYCKTYWKNPLLGQDKN